MRRTGPRWPRLTEADIERAAGNDHCRRLEGCACRLAAGMEPVNIWTPNVPLRFSGGSGYGSPQPSQRIADPDHTSGVVG
jgi:hypothetical protein